MTRHRHDRIAKSTKHRLEEELAPAPLLEDDEDPRPPKARLGVPGKHRQPLHGHATDTGEVMKR